MCMAADILSGTQHDASNVGELSTEWMYEGAGIQSKSASLLLSIKQYLIS